MKSAAAKPGLGGSVILSNMRANMRTVAGSVAVALVLAGCAMVNPAKQQMPNTFILFFRAQSAELTPDAAKIVDQAAQAVKDLRPSTVSLAGFAFNLGDPALNKRMSESRIATVERALVADGVDPKLILRLPEGAPEDSVGPTGDRRIVITLQFGK